MLWVSLEQLIDHLKYEAGLSLTLTELSEKTGVSRKTLSKMMNNPTATFSTEQIGMIISYAFDVMWEHYKKTNEDESRRPQRLRTPRDVMREVLSSLIAFYPSKPEYFKEVTEVLGISPSPTIEELSRHRPSLMWGLYETFNNYDYEYIDEDGKKFKKVRVVPIDEEE